MFKHTVARLRLAGVSLIWGDLSQERVEGDFMRRGLEVYVPILGIGWAVEGKKAREGGDN